MHDQPDGRIAPKEFRQQRRQRVLSQGDRATEPDDAAGFSLGKFHGRHGRLGFTQHGGGVPVDLLADVGDREPPRGAVDQPHGQAGLQVAHMARQARFGDPEGPSGGCVAFVFDDLGEIIKVVERLHGERLTPKIERDVPICPDYHLPFHGVACWTSPSQTGSPP